MASTSSWVTTAGSWRSSKRGVQARSVPTVAARSMQTASHASSCSRPWWSVSGTGSGGFPSTTQLLGRQSPLRPVPVRRVRVRLEPLGHFEHGDQPPVREPDLPPPPFRRRVNDRIAGPKTGREIAAPTARRDRGDGVLEVGLAAAEAVDERRQGVFQHGLPAAGGFAQRPVRTEINAGVVGHTRKLGIGAATATSAPLPCDSAHPARGGVGAISNLTALSLRA